MTTFISIVLGALNAIPILDSWFQTLVSAYVQSRIASMKQENLDAIRIAIQNHDQRPIENAIDSPTAGKVSGDAGAIVVDGASIGLPKPPGS